MITSQVKAVFWNRVTVAGDDECWLWTGSKYKRYGRLFIRGKLIGSAHRISWQIHFGPIPEKMFVIQTCLNPLCVNPKHLALTLQPRQWRLKKAYDSLRPLLTELLVNEKKNQD